MKEILKVVLTNGQFVKISYDAAARRYYVVGPYRIGPGQSITHEITSFGIDKNWLWWIVLTANGEQRRIQTETQIKNIL